MTAASATLDAMDDYTRVRLPKAIAREAKASAARAGVTLEAWLRQAVEAQIKREAASRSP